MATYYDILQVSKEASLIDIKKAYRKLALLYHPDRNNGSSESTEKFKKIGEAYEVLSNPQTRREYDNSLIPRTSSHHHSNDAPRNRYNYHENNNIWHNRQRNHVDPFTQFNDLFQNDPFFQQAFQDMDDTLTRRMNEGTTTTETNKKNEGWGKATSCINSSNSNSSEGWFMKLLRLCGIQVEISSYSSNRNGTTSTHYSTTNRSSYVNKTSKTYIDPKTGQKITMQTFEKNGNLIEDQYVGQRLVERRVNNVVEPLHDITIS